MCNFAVGLFTPPLLESIGWATYLFYAAWNVVAFFVVWKWFVETKGKTLEEIDAIFADGAATAAIDKSFSYHNKEQSDDGKKIPTSSDSLDVTFEGKNQDITNQKEHA